MYDYAERCCGKVATSPLADPANVSDVECPHEFFIVRRNAKTGELHHIEVTPAPVLVRMQIVSHEWKEGLPDA